MLCKYCKKEIENDSIFCRFCGQKVVRARRKPKEEINVAPPAVTPSGKYRGRVMVDGHRIWITEDNEAAYYIRARAVKAGMIEQAKAAPKDTLVDLIDRYLKDNDAILSPSTLAAYNSLRKNRFPAYMGESISRIPWQLMISRETESCSAKTVRNAWQLVSSALKYSKYDVPTVNLPKAARSDRSYLDYTQIQTFLQAIRDDDHEFAYLLALHSLRLSEILALTPGCCDNGVIRVRGAVVRGPSGAYVRKDLNKTDLSRRDIQIMIPRLNALLHKLPVTASDRAMNLHLEKICESSGLPRITMHCLRHSFASLAYHLRWQEKTVMQIGGWSTPEVVNEIYTHLSALDKNDDVERMRLFYDASSVDG